MWTEESDGKVMRSVIVLDVHRGCLSDRSQYNISIYLEHSELNYLFLNAFDVWTKNERREAQGHTQTERQTDDLFHCTFSFDAKANM